MPKKNPPKRTRNPLRLRDEAITNAENFIRLKQKQLLKGDAKAIEWTVQVHLKHWHAAGIGCGPDCLKGIVYQSDPDRVKKKRYDKN